MTVTGNTSDDEVVMHEKTECAACGRMGFVRFREGLPYVVHPYSEPCVVQVVAPTFKYQHPERPYLTKWARRPLPKPVEPPKVTKQYRPFAHLRSVQALERKA